jgi:2-polyprenyl-3-methyl-5-hydroxy-6-metoxy-1,4-benzoquinol methylase
MKTETLDKCNICSSKSILTIDDTIYLCKCSECGYIFDSPRPTPEAIAEFYSKPTQYDDWIAELEDRDGLWLRRIEKLKATKKEGNVLDIGAGIGQFLHHAKSHYQNVFGTEVSESAIDTALTRYGINLIQGSIETIDFGDREFDNITMFHVLEHVHDPRFVVKKCYDLLSEGGLYIVAVPNDIQSVKSKLTLLKQAKKLLSSSRINSYGKYGLAKITLDENDKEIHLSHFTPTVLKKLMESCGFEVVESSLDPYYVRDSITNNLWYSIHNFIYSVTKNNYYDTIWMVGKK